MEVLTIPNPKDRPKLCPKKGQDMMSKIFPRFFLVCQIYSKDMPKICPDMPNMFQRYAQDMLNVCPIIG